METHKTIMSQDLKDEMEALDAIYSGCVCRSGPLSFKVNPPERSCLSVTIVFPSDYPEQIPTIVEVTLTDSQKYPDTNYIRRHFVDILERVYSRGSVCIYEFQIEVQEFLNNYDASSPKISRYPMNHSEQGWPHFNTGEEQIVPRQAETPLQGWCRSETINDRGSTFIAFLRRVQSVEEAKTFLDAIVTDTKIAKSSHNMTAWRIKNENGIQFQDFDDDGELAGGSRILHLLTVRNLEFLPCS